jgi:hypothetical protein
MWIKLGALSLTASSLFFLELFGILLTQGLKIEHTGFIKVDNPEQYGLIPNQNVVKTDNAYMMSFYHQLHCLHELQVQYVRLYGIVSSHEYDYEGWALHEEERNHAEHCFSYIRQAIQCSGDITLEGPDLVRESGQSPLRGWGVQHQCRNWENMVRWVDEHAAS